MKYLLFVIGDALGWFDGSDGAPERTRYRQLISSQPRSSAPPVSRGRRQTHEDDTIARYLMLKARAAKRARIDYASRPQEEASQYGHILGTSMKYPGVAQATLGRPERNGAIQGNFDGRS